MKIQTPSINRHLLARKIKVNLSALALALLTGAWPTSADDLNGHDRTPDLPAPACDSLEVPVGNQVRADRRRTILPPPIRWERAGVRVNVPQNRKLFCTSPKGTARLHGCG